MSIRKIGNWHTGVSGLSNKERLVALHCEHEARQRAIQSWYEERLLLTDSVLCDACDLDVSSVRIQWSRKRGYLYLVMVCENHRANRVRHYRWRVDVRRAAGRAFDSIVKRGVSELE